MLLRPDRRFHPAACLALAAFLIPVLSAAHTGAVHEHVMGMGSGFTHPFTGLDHLLAMLAVGLWAGQLGGRSLWAVPAGFVALMTGGGVLALSGVAVPAVEPGILASLVMLGLAIATAVRVPSWLGAAGVGCFAVFHGAAHGLEIPVGVSGVAYGTGFIAATALLHVAGAGAAQALQRRNLALVTRLAGTAIGIVGLTLIYIEA